MSALLADLRAVAGCLERLALVLAASERLEAAAWVFGAADAAHKMVGIEPRQDAEADHAHFVAVTRQNLGDGFAATWLAGQSASVDEAVARALARDQRRTARRRKPGRRAGTL